MFKYLLPLIDNLNFDANANFESAGVDSTPGAKSEAGAQNLITRTGGATLADFFVTLAHQAMPASLASLEIRTQGRRLQFEKEGI